MAVIAWPLFAFGGVYLWAAVPFALGAVLLALLCPPTPGAPADAASLDRWLIVTGVALLVPLVPLPAQVLGLVSPHTAELLAALRLDYFAQTAAGATPATPLSIDARATIWAVAITGATLLIFLVARRVFAGGGLRTVVRALAWIGLILAAVALLQRATSRHVIYWFWTPLTEGAEPFGPFVNRNHFGTFAIMAIPTILGYLLARLDANWTPDGRPQSFGGVAGAFDGRSSLLLASGTLLTVAAVVCLSRSALVGLGAALAIMGSLAHRRLDPRRRAWATVYAVLLAAAVLAWTNVDAVLGRLDQTLTRSSGRVEIWRDTMGVVRDFWVGGTGAGTFQVAMRVYQTADRTVHFNHAHNHYLQVLAEGGLLVAVPAALALVAFLQLTRRRLAEEHFAIYWIRLGAATGLLAAGVQSLWETGLRMPANAALAAVLAAIAAHPTRRIARSQADHAATSGI